MTWRDGFRPIITRVLKETAGMTLREQNAALRKAFPGGLRENFPYKCWLDEIRVQRGLKKFGGLSKGEKLPVVSQEGQQELFK